MRLETPFGDCCQSVLCHSVHLAKRALLHGAFGGKIGFVIEPGFRNSALKFGEVLVWDKLGIITVGGHLVEALAFRKKRWRKMPSGRLISYFIIYCCIAPKVRIYCPII